MTTASKTLQSWCTTCGTRHGRFVRCPGELLATGVERHGWRGLADTPRGPEVYGTLVAPVERGWRARILTYPNVLWVGRDRRVGTLKFLGDTPSDAEAQAIAYIRSICERNGFTLRKEMPAVESAVVDPEQTPELSNCEAVRASQRKLKRLPLRYGITRPNQDAETDDISEGGMFVRTPKPPARETALKLYLETPGFGIPLQGIVTWRREGEVEGRPAGMGIRLINPHPRYLHYVRQQFDERASAASDEHAEEAEEATALDEWTPESR